MSNASQRQERDRVVDKERNLVVMQQPGEWSHHRAWRASTSAKYDKRLKCPVIQLVSKKVTTYPFFLFFSQKQKDHFTMKKLVT